MFGDHHAKSSARLLLNLRLTKNTCAAEERTYIWLRPPNRPHPSGRRSFTSLGASNTPPITAGPYRRETCSGTTDRHRSHCAGDAAASGRCAQRHGACGVCPSATQAAVTSWTRSFPSTSNPLRELLSMVRLCCRQASRCRPQQISVYRTWTMAEPAGGYIYGRTHHPTRVHAYSDTHRASSPERNRRWRIYMILGRSVDLARTLI